MIDSDPNRKATLMSAAQIRAHLLAYIPDAEPTDAEISALVDFANAESMFALPVETRRIAHKYGFMA